VALAHGGTEELAHIKRLRAGAMSSSTDVRAPAAEPLLLCAWSGLVLGQLPAAPGQDRENSDVVARGDCGGSWGPREEQRPMSMLFPHGPRSAVPLVGVFRGVSKIAYPHHNSLYLCVACACAVCVCCCCVLCCG
jgi:hypothetical protein